MFCQSLDQLNDFPTITLLYNILVYFRRYNVTLPSSASVERLFSQGGLIFSSRRLKLTETFQDASLF
ncbi:Uncharacterized protein APZ42_029924 [Daphnia magna]|uniref:HAT C-terminal dimerisation domain-containing protein n=1 Tax=Daphnia magna TaxID=35525 RepID=A0A164P7I2_9CRUS|nr:Uncharacterized protein APZ42_029924 [Daphnia magna]